MVFADIKILNKLEIKERELIFVGINIIYIYIFIATDDTRQGP